MKVPITAAFLRWFHHGLGRLLLALSLLLPAAHGALDYLNARVPITPDLGYTVVPSFEGADGVLYGFGSHPTQTNALVSFNKNGSDFKVLHVLGSVPEDGWPVQWANVVEGKDGQLYGFSPSGGTNRTGIIFKLKPDGTEYQVLHTFPENAFTAVGGGVPTSLVIDSVNGLLCGTAQSGNLVFRLNTDGTGFSVVHSFTASESSPRNLIFGSDRLLYGKSGSGTSIFRVKPDGSDFAWLKYVGSMISLFEAADGRLYGATIGDASHQGGVFQMNRDGSGYTNLYRFDRLSARTLIPGHDGALYGTANVGADPATVLLYRMDSDGGFTWLFTANLPSLRFEASNGTIYGESGLMLVPVPAGAPRIFTQGTEVVLDRVQYYGTTKFSLTSSVPKAQIFYTTDGSAPTSNSVPYLLPFEISVDTVLRTVAYTTNLTDSAERAAVNIDIVPVRTLRVILSGGVNGAAPGVVKVDPAPVISGPTAGEYRYLPDTTVSVTVEPAREYRFLGWDGASGGTETNKVVTLSSDVQLAAMFVERPKVTLTTFVRYGDSEGKIAGNYPVPVGGSVEVLQPKDSTIELVALPKPGWTFVRWRGDASGTNPTNYVFMDRIKSVEAIFGTDVGTSVVGDGTVEFSPPVGPYLGESKVLLFARPAPGYFLAHWGGMANSNFNPVTYTVDPRVVPQDIAATFLPIPEGQFLLTVNVDGPGFVSGNPARNTFTPGQFTTLTATPATGETFRGWTYQVGGQEFTSLNPMLSFAVTAEATATAHFGTVQVPAITRPPQPVTVVQGYSATFTVQGSGGQPLTYQWRRGNGALSENARFHGTTNTTLTITPVNAVDAGSYSVEIRNAVGAATSVPVLLTVLDGLADTDGDGLRNADEAALGTDPTLVDTDGDGLSDFRESAELHTNPKLADTDGDGFSDGVEVAAGTDPLQGGEAPEKQLTAYFAVELEFITTVGRRYQLQKSADLQTWVNVDAPFTSTAAVSSRFASARNAESGYWRLVDAP